MKIMNIAYLTSVYARASDTFIRNEVVELRQRGHHVHTFSIRREKNDANVSTQVASEQASTDYILENPSIYLIFIFIAQIFFTPGAMIQAFILAASTRAPGLKGAFLQIAYLIEAAYLASRLKKLDVDILHNHIAENSANVAMLASVISGIPYSMTVHGPGIFFHPEKWALGVKIARSAFTATITNFCKSQCMLFSDPLAWDKLHVVRCSAGKDFEHISSRPVTDRPRILFVGRLCAEKGLLILIEAVARHIESGMSCELAIIGDGPLRAKVQEFVRQRDLDDFIKLLGWKNSQEIRTEIENSRALVLPSFAEGLPVVIMESFALGRPVITTQIAGIPELVISGKNGWLVAPGSVEEFSLALKEVSLASPDSIEEMGKLGKAKLNQLHDFSAELGKLESLFKTAVESVK